MKQGEYDVMAASEDRLWWYRALHRLVVSSLERFLAARTSPCVVDVGCGTGGTYAQIRGRFPGVRYIGIDVEPLALDHCRRRGLRAVIQGSASAVPVRAACADAVVCLDVLYYASIDPAAAVGQLGAALKPGGLLLLNLPAFESLRGRHDQAVGIAKRFRIDEMRRLLEQARLEPVLLTYWNAALFLPLMAWRWFSRGAGQAEAISDTGRSPRWLNAVLVPPILLEIYLTRWVRYPFGSSVFAVARRAG